jgi:hypothetical protein
MKLEDFDPEGLEAYELIMLIADCFHELSDRFTYKLQNRIEELEGRGHVFKRPDEQKKDDDGTK